MPWPQNRRNSLPCTVRTSRHRSCSQRVCCLLLYVVRCSMAKNNDLWDWSMDKRTVRSLVPCFGQDGNRPQHPIDSRKHFVVLVWWIPAYNFLLTLILLDVIVYVLFAGIKKYTWYWGNGLLDKLWTWHIVQIL